MEQSGFVHDEKQCRFYLAIKGVKDSENCPLIDYRITPEGKYDLYHTGTPPSLRGLGLAGKLTASVLAWCDENNVEFIPSCSYIAYYVEKNNKV